ncbi:MAG: hypothetical protein DRN17_05805 [Thermoplasmata archaeon]|nr:MAG: hypothetical protein DRN17_05805 [Thermoplasmata archaeon]
MQLSKLIIPITETEFDFPGMEGFKLTIAYITRDELLKIRKKSTHTTFNKRSHSPEEEVDSDIFQDLYVKAVIKGWRGLSLKYVSKLVPIDLSTIEDDSVELDYDHENAMQLMKNAPNFDSFVSDMVADLENFIQSS